MANSPKKATFRYFATELHPLHLLRTCKVRRYLQMEEEKKQSPQDAKWCHFDSKDYYSEYVKRKKEMENAHRERS